MSDFGQKLQGLLGDPTFNLGIGLLAAGGQRRGPRVSFGQGLMEATQFANQQSQAYNQLQAQRNQLDAQKRQRDAMGRLGSIMQRGLLSPGQIAQGVQGQMGVGRDDMGLLDPQAAQRIAQGTNFWSGVQNQAQAEIPGLLAQANPGAYTQAATQAMFAPQTSSLPNSAKEFMFAQELNQANPGMGGEYLELIGSDNRLRELQADLALIQARRESRELDQEAAEEGVLRRRVESGRETTVREVNQILNNMENLIGTVAQPGFFGDAAQRGLSLRSAIENLRGLSGTDSQALASSSEMLGKGFTRITTQTVPDAFAGSNQKLEFFQQQTPGLNLQPLTNLSILENTLLDIINDDFVDDGEVNTSGEAQQVLERLRELKMQIQGRNVEPAPPPNTIPVPE